MLHEFSRVEMNEKADEGNHCNHHQGKCVEIETDIWLEACNADPGPEDLVIRMTGRRRDYELGRVQHRHQSRDVYLNHTETRDIYARAPQTPLRIHHQGKCVEIETDIWLEACNADP